MKLKRPSEAVYLQSPFEKGKYPCPLCGGTNRMKCQVTEDGGLAYCTNKGNDSGKQDSLGRYEHILTSKAGGTAYVPPAKPVLDESTARKSDATTLSEVYNELLDSLMLSEEHGDNLLNERGLSDGAITRNLYATVPSFNRGQDIADAISEKLNVEGVPGFYQQGNNWKLNLGYPGFYVPFRDVEGRIVALQIRLDKPIEKQKYLWLSSSGKEKGTSSGSPLHFVRPEVTKQSKTVYLTEGALKADIIGDRLDLGVIAMAGVTAFNPQKLVAEILRSFPDLEKIAVAFDADWATNDNVRTALVRILAALREVSALQVEAVYWDSNRGKGLDDLVVNEDFTVDEIQHISAEEFIEKFLAAPSVLIEDAENEEDNSSPFHIGESTEVHDEEFELALEGASNELGQLWRDFSLKESPSAEKVIFGLGRGNLGLLNATTNIGKSTLITNLSLCMTSNQSFEPLFEAAGRARRVMYIDGEASRDDLKMDIKTMLSRFSESEVESVKENLLILCEEEINDEPLDLADPQHLRKIRERAIEFEADLVVIDTLSALVNLDDENDNAQVKRQIIQPLKQLAKVANSAVLLLHHTGKYNEGFAPAGAYKGRGASAFGALSRLVLTLDKPKNAKGNVRLSCAKVKGKAFPNTIIKLNEHSRWFSFLSSEASGTSDARDEYSQIVNFVLRHGKPIRRKVIVAHFKGHISRTKVDRHLENAVAGKEICKPKYGFYSAPLNPKKELALAE